jgi:hypothetical protein
MTTAIKASAPLFYHLDLFDSIKVAKNAVGPVRFICDKLEQVVAFFQVSSKEILLLFHSVKW